MTDSFFQLWQICFYCSLLEITLQAFILPSYCEGLHVGHTIQMKDLMAISKVSLHKYHRIVE